MRSLLPACLIFICVVHSQAQKNVFTLNPEKAGFSTERLARIDSFMARQLSAGRMAGGAALIIRKGEPAYYQSFGYNDDRKNEGLKKEAIFRIASQTKAITSVAIMILLEEGKLLLQDPVEKYIPEFANARVIERFNREDTSYITVPAKRKITIHDLLTHTSGIGYPYIGSEQAKAIYHKHDIPAGIGTEGLDLAAAMKKLGGLPLFHQPGEAWTYGLNTDLLGYLIQVISGKSIDMFFKEKIFDPLGMTDTYFLLPPSKHQRLASLFVADERGRLSLFNKSQWEVDGNFPLGKSQYFSGGAGLSSTLKDYAAFLQMLLNDGVYNGKRILSRASVRMMTSNQIGALKVGENKFGLGFFLVSEENAAKTGWNSGSFGWGGAFATTYWVDPKENMVALFFRQVWGDRNADINESFKILTYQAIND